MGNSNTEHSKRLRAISSAASKQKKLDAGAIRFSVMLEPPYAQQLQDIAAQTGSKKQAIVFLLDFYKKNIDNITATP